jgi:hypothetical protein
VAEVRERIVADLQLLDGFELAKSWGESLRHFEDVEGLREAFDADGELAELFSERQGHGGGFFESTLVPRVNQALVDAGLDFGMSYVGGGIGMVPHDVVDQWFGLEDTVDHRGVFELSGRASMLVVEWVETFPATVEQFEAMKGRLANQIASRRMQDVIADWFNPENVRARNGFKLASN